MLLFTFSLEERIYVIFIQLNMAPIFPFVWEIIFSGLM